jgi:hypothetical protein
VGFDRETSWKRLRAHGFNTSIAVLNSLKAAGAVLQLVENGTNDYLYDEYTVDVTAMPSGVTPASFLTAMESNLNGTVKDQEFDNINKFTRRNGGQPQLGEIVDIEIGVDNGSVILAELGPTYFIYQTIWTPKYGYHPEDGAREFGFQQKDGTTVTFYTRGVSRPRYFLAGLVGPYFQARGWTALMHGISTQIVARGGASQWSSFSHVSKKQQN